MKPLRLVAIGASKGGLAAFQELLENLPNDTGMAFVVLSHILRHSKSLLPEILAKSTKMPIHQATEGLGLLANHIYILPPDKLMKIESGLLRLFPRPEKGPNRAIDCFLFSLAKDTTYEGIGIVLSGEGSDGAEGMKILKEQTGGLTIAQEPDSASSESMPIRAIEIDHVDRVLRPVDIARQLASLSWCDENVKSEAVKVLWSGES